MRKVQGLAWFARWVGGVCILCIPLTVLADKKETKSKDHGVSSTAEKSKSDDEKKESASKSKKADENLVSETFRNHFSSLPDPVLGQLINSLDETLNLNGESFNKLVDELKLDEKLKAELKKDFKRNAEALGSEPQKLLAQIAKDIMKGRLDEGEKSEAELQKLLDEKLAEFKKIEDEFQKTKKQIEEESQARIDELQKTGELPLEDQALPFDPSLLAKGGQGAGDAGAGAGSGDSGSGSGSGSGGGSGAGGGSGSESRRSTPERSKPDNTSNRFNDFAKALESKPEEAKPVTASSSSSERTPRASSLQDASANDETKSPTPTPYVPEEPLPAKPRKLGALGSGNIPQPIPPAGAFSGSQGGSAASGGGGSVAPMMGALGGGGGSSGYGSGASGAFPDVTGIPSGGPSDQKFSYSREVGFGSSSGDGGEAAYEGEPSVDSQVASASTLGTLTTMSRAPRAMAVGNEPAFAKAIGMALGNLCQTGSLNCDRTVHPRRGKK